MEGIKTRQIMWHPKTKKLSQVANEGLEFALVSDDYQQIHQLVWCKDFIQDAIHGFLNQSVSTIYGFKYDPAVDLPLSTKRTKLLVANWKDKELGCKIVNRALPLIHEVEDRLKMSRTVLEKGDNVPPRYGKSGLWLLNSSKRWSKAPPMISFFTLLIRIGLIRNPADNLEAHIKKIKNRDVESYYSNCNQDKFQVEQAEKGILKILKYGDRRLFYADPKKNFPPINHSLDLTKKVTISTIHEYCGIASYSKETTKTLFPYWHRL